MRGRGFGRTALAASATVLALAASGAAAAQDAPAPYVDAGKAQAAATVVSVAPTAGSLQFAFKSGETVAETSGGSAAALAQSFNLGLIGSSLAGEGCDGGDPVLQPDQIPSASKVENRNGPASIDVSEVPVAFGGLGAGREIAAADMVPSGRAESTTLGIELPGLLSIGGGTSTSSATVLPGAGREASAGVQLDITVAGVLQLRGLRWTALHRSGPGAEPAATGSFELAGLSAAGLPIPFEDLAQAETAANAVLLPLGLQLELPRIEHLTDPVDIVRVTPLRLRVADSPLGELGVRPALDLTRALRSQLFDALVAVNCSASSAFLIGEIVLGIGAGTGSLIAELGGVQATSADVVFEDAFGDGGAPPPAVEEPAAPAPASPAGPAPTAPPGPVPTVARPVTPVAPGAVPVASLGPGSERCESVHPNRAPACSTGALGVVGGVGLLGTAGVAVLDLRRRRVAS